MAKAGDHAQLYQDHSYLWETYGAAHDMTGGYVDQDDLAKLLKTPTKKVAADCLLSQIEHWFDITPEDFSEGVSGYSAEQVRDDPDVQAIRKRWDIVHAWYD